MFSFMRRKLEPEYIKSIRKKELSVPFNTIEEFLNKASELIVDLPINVKRAKYGISKTTTHKIESIYIDDRYIDYDKFNELYARMVSIYKQLRKKMKNNYPPNVYNVYHNYYAFLSRMIDTIEEDLDKS